MWPSSRDRLRLINEPQKVSRRVSSTWRKLPPPRPPCKTLGMGTGKETETRNRGWNEKCVSKTWAENLSRVMLRGTGIGTDYGRRHCIGSHPLGDIAVSHHSEYMMGTKTEIKTGTTLNRVKSFTLVCHITSDKKVYL